MIHKIIPAYKDYLWGGTRLKEDYNKSAQGIIAESWELSCHGDGMSYLSGGCSLGEYVQKNPVVLGKACEKFDMFPILVKLIDAKKDLSLQVHPSDEYALKNEGEYGKTEMWYVVDSAPGAFIYCGFKENITKPEFERAIINDNLTDMLNKIEVKKGDAFFIYAGCLHAIGAGCLIAEVQQNSNLTYRVSDFGRVDINGKPRELHVDKAIEVTSFHKFVPRIFEGHLSKCEYFTVDLLHENSRMDVGFDSFKHIMAIEDDAILTCSGQTVTLKKGESAFVDAGSGEVEIQCQGNTFVSYVS